MHTVFQILWVLLLAFLAACFAAFAGAQFFMQNKQGFEGIAHLLGWLMGGGMGGILLGVILVRRIAGATLRTMVLVMAGVALLLIFLYLRKVS